MKSKLLGLALLSLCPLFSQVAITTHHYDNARTGANLTELSLNTSNVNPGQFGMLFTYPVDGSVYAQPLYVPGVPMSGGSTHNVVYLATMNNSVYAYDADSNTGTNAAPLWVVNYNNAAAGVTPVPSTDVQAATAPDVTGPIGIMGTPVIDPATYAMYFVVRTKENGAYLQRLHAVDVRSGIELSNSPTVITGTISGSTGTATFDPMISNQRPALGLANGLVYIAWASHNDRGSYHGWIMSYSTYSPTQTGTPLQQQNVFATTLGKTGGGIWQSGSGPAIDSTGNLYYGTGNGFWDGTSNFGQSTLKLSPSLQLLDYFTPYNWLSLENTDGDLGVGGVLLFPGTDLVVETSKSGTLFVLSTAAMGHVSTNNSAITQTLQGAKGHIHCGPTYWNSPTQGPLLYIWSETDYLKAFHFNGTGFDTTPAMTSTVHAAPGMPGAFLAVSSNGATPGSGVVWANVPFSGDANHAVVPGVLRAFNADNLTTELWDSHMNASRDDFGNFAKFVPPVVANGKVYMATFSNQVAVYGLLPVAPGIYESLSAPTLSLNQNTSGTLSTNITSSGTLPSAISISATGVPAGVTVQINPLAVSGAGSSSIGVSVASAATPGTYVIPVVAASGPYSASQSLTLTVGSSAQAPIQIDAGGGTAGTFLADTDFVGGYTSFVTKQIDMSHVSNPAPLAVYQSERYQNSTYTIPNLVAGQQYLVRLHFAETYFTAAGQRKFNVAINGTSVLQNFDVLAAAGGPNTAVIEEFTTTPNSLGQIVIAFANGLANHPAINGIELTSPPTGLRINSGGGNAGTFIADTDVSGGYTSAVNKPIDLTHALNPAPLSVYQSERYQNSTYTIPNLVASQQYLVRLHFAEVYFTTSGQRKFNAAINGTSVLQNFDIVAAAGAPNTAVVQEFTVTPNSLGQIVIAFTKGSANYPKIDGIEVK